MIVSHQHELIFIRTRKTAGTSIEIALSRLLGNDAIITALSPRDEQLRRRYGGRGPQNHTTDGRNRPVPPGPGRGIRFYNHMPTARLERILGASVWRRYFCFCVERNPWDKVISLYYHRHRRTPRPTVTEFLRSGEAADALNWPLYSSAGDIMVDKVCRYESLTEDLAAALAEVGITDLGPLPRAKGHFRPAGAGYRAEMTEDDRRLTAALFATEIDAHGYAW